MGVPRPPGAACVGLAQSTRPEAALITQEGKKKEKKLNLIQ